MKKIILPILMSLALGAGFISARHVNVKAEEEDLTPDFSENFESYEDLTDYSALGERWTNAWYKHLGDFDEIACSDKNFNLAKDPTDENNKCLYVHTYESNESFFYLTIKNLMVKDFRLTYKFMQTDTHSVAPWAGFNFRKEVDGRYNGVTNCMMVMRAWDDTGFSPQMYRSVGDSLMNIELVGPTGEGPAIGVSDPDGLVNKWIDIKIEAIGPNFSIYGNDVLLGSAEITKKTANCYGLVSIVSCVDNAYFDDIHLENLDEVPYDGGGSGEEESTAPTMETKAYEVREGEDLVIECDTHGEAITSFKRGAEEVLPQYYEVDGIKITISKDYLATLGYAKQYFIIATKGGSVSFTVTVLEDKPQEGSETEPVTPSDSSSEQQPAKKGGCGGSIIATSALLSIVALMGVGLVSIKRRK